MYTPDLAALAQLLPDAVVVLDRDAMIAWANPAAERIFGRPLDSVIGVFGPELVHPDDVGAVLLGVETLQHEPVGRPIEVRILASDGWRLVELVGSALDDGAMLLSLRDLTERRRFEIARDEEARFRSLVHNAGTVTMLVTKKGVVESISGAITRLTGRDPIDIESMPLTTILATEADRCRLTEALSAAQSGRLTTAVVDVASQPEGLPVPMELTIVNLLDDPTVHGYVVSGHEVSERIAVEGELRSALSLLNATLDSTADGILVVDAEGNITSSNQRFVDMWRIPAEIIASRDDQAALSRVLDQLIDPDAFVAKVNELYAAPDDESYDILDFQDGRVFERFSRPQRVDGAVVGRVWSFRDLTQRKRLEDELIYRAFHDQLTGLPNKAKFCDRLEHAAERSRRLTTGYAVLFLEIDNFKTVNDSLGHQAGDQLLVEAATILQLCLRRADTAARLGGDEFAILIEDIEDPETATHLATRIIESFRRPFRIADRDVFATASIGVAFGSGATTSEQILRDADLAMYTAKSLGKNRHELFEVEQHTAVLLRVEVEADLHRAIERDELTLFYQPMLHTNSGRMAGVEALVRWIHPTRGLLLPGAFVPMAEDAGLMEVIGRQILALACRQAQTWSEQGARDLTVSVNVSPRQLSSAAIVSDVDEILRATGLPARRLTLEITETAMMRDTEVAGRNLHDLKALGVMLALDDFGTGYSSLTYLQQFPIDIVKIDKSFVDSIAERGDAQSLAPAIIQLAQSLGLRTVAEGVEHPRQLQRLRALGCDLVQGFLLHRPMTVDAINELLADQAADRPHAVAS